MAQTLRNKQHTIVNRPWRAIAGDLAEIASTIGLDDDRCNIVILEIALHKLSCRMVDTICNIQRRIVAEIANLIKHALGAKFVAIGPGGLGDPIG
jgi:hypothetical protein